MRTNHDYDGHPDYAPSEREAELLSRLAGFERQVERAFMGKTGDGEGWIYLIVHMRERERMEPHTEVYLTRWVEYGIQRPPTLTDVEGPTTMAFALTDMHSRASRYWAEQQWRPMSDRPEYETRLSGDVLTVRRCDGQPMTPQEVKALKGLLKEGGKL